MIAGLPMYDWPERRPATDALWARLRDALRAAEFDAPDALTRMDDLQALWLAPDLLLAQTCAYPFETALRGRVRYVATPVHGAPGCGRGTYRSVVIARGLGEDMVAPVTPDATLPIQLSGRLAANAPDSLSGYVALARDLEATGLAMPGPALWTGAHRASIRAVAEGEADVAAIDCVSWRIAQAHEPTAARVRVIGWTAERPGLPLITSRTMTDDDLVRLRRAIAAAMPIAVLDRPAER